MDFSVSHKFREPFDFSYYIMVPDVLSTRFIHAIFLVYPYREARGFALEFTFIYRPGAEGPELMKIFN